MQTDTDHLGNSPVCHDVTCMNETIQHFCRLLYQVTLVWVAVQLIICTVNQ